MTGSRSVRERAASVRLVAVDVDGTLTDGGMYYSADGEALKRFDTRDAMGLGLVRSAGVEVAIVTSEDSKIVAARAAKLGICHVFLGVKDKVECLARLLSELGFEWADLAFIGDDVNDHPVLAKAGLSACPADAPGSTPALVHYVCANPGGRGAVRELCELILSARTAEMGE